jgi:hypothetical protein
MDSLEPHSLFELRSTLSWPYQDSRDSEGHFPSSLDLREQSDPLAVRLEQIVSFGE